MKNRKNFRSSPIKELFMVALFASVITFIVGCSSNKSSSSSSTPAPTPEAPAVKSLYVTSGACYSGNNTTFTTTTASNMLYRINASTGIRDITLADFNAFPANTGDSPVGFVDWDADNLLVLVENAAGRKIELLPKRLLATRSNFYANTTTLSAVLRTIVKTGDSSLLISKSSAIEKVTSTGIRVGASFINTNMGATCGTANANITSISLLSNSKVIFTNAVASNNRIGMISASGYSSAPDCLAVQSPPNANSYPTASVYLPAVNQLIVAYAGNATTTALNSIYVYDISETANTFTNATKIYDVANYPGTYDYLLYGISAMAYDFETNELYVSTAVSTTTTVANYAIEKFTYNSTAKSLTRVGSVPFYNYGFDTKCISEMQVAY